MLKTVRLFIFSLIGVLILIDIVLVLNDAGFPTFSTVVKDQRSLLIGFTFLFGGLVAKIFFNRMTIEKRQEKKGVFWFAIIVILLTVVGILLQRMEITVKTWHQFVLLITGGVLAHILWPQFKESGRMEEQE